MRIVVYGVIIPDFHGSFMRTQSIQRFIAIGLGVWLILVSTSLASPMTSHAIDPHHTQESHSQTWCDWICKAGQTIHTASSVLTQSYDLLTPAFLPYPNQPPSSLIFSPDSRAPPAFSTLKVSIDITHRGPTFFQY